MVQRPPPQSHCRAWFLQAHSCRPGAILILCGAGTRIRTRDLLITNQLLYQLSYTGEEARAVF